MLCPKLQSDCKIVGEKVKLMTRREEEEEEEGKEENHTVEKEALRDGCGVLETNGEG